jgi:hypothetical protein
MVLGDAKMRGRKKDSAPDWLQHVPDAFKGVVLQQMNATRRSRSSTSCGSAFAVMDADSPLPSADLLRGNNKQAQPGSSFTTGFGEASPSSCPPDTTCPSAGALGEEGADDVKLATPPPPPSVEALEEAMLAGLLKKKPAAAVVLKRPAAAVVIKRPAAAVVLKPVVDMSGLFAKLRARKGTMSRKGFTSMAYHNAKTMAENAGFTAEQAKVIAREALGKASALYDRA